MDYGTLKTDEEIKDLDNRIQSVYFEARQDLQKRLKTFIHDFKAKEAIHAEQVARGEWTKEQYDRWLSGQVFQGKLWMRKRDEITQLLRHSNKQAVSLINSYRTDAFVENANYEAYRIEKGLNVDLGFTLFNSEAVNRLIKDDPKILPEWKIDEPKDYIWNRKAVNNTITQGIIQGKKLTDIAKMLSDKLVSKNMNKMLTFARTGMTQAQNAGRLTRLYETRDMGIHVVKEWMATLDERTRTTHKHLDGKRVAIDKPFKIDGYEIDYPGDPEATASLVFNCRCTLVEDFDDMPLADYERRDNISGELIENMSYDEWYDTKYQTHQIASNVMDAARRVEKSVTKDFKTASGLGKGHLEGLDFRFKGRTSLERKIVDKSAKKGISQTEYALQITDALRYTNVSEPEDLVNDFFKMKKSLESKGYEIVEITNTLGDVNKPYRGINTLVRTPNGYLVELQFHTPQSLEIKEINHKLYEEQRLASTPEKMKKKLERQMMENARLIKSPVHIEDIGNKLLDSPIKQW